MMPLNHILKMQTYQITGKDQSPKLHGRHQTAKNEKEFENLICAVRIYSQDIGIEFGIEKCTMLLIKSGKRHMTEEMEQLI